MSRLKFREDAYLQSCDATITAVSEHRGLLADQTVFYPTSGGQPGDRGEVIWNGGRCRIATTIYDENRLPVHVAAEGEALPAVGTPVKMVIDWTNRHRVMRCHTMMHLLCAAVPYPVTGSSITDGGGRIDFDIPDGQTPDRDWLTATINGWISEAHPVSTRWISEAELDANPQLVRTLSVKPPRGAGNIRLVLIGENGIVDMQPCGGTHVRNTREIGPVAVDKIESKGKINRRIRLALVDP